MSRIPEAANKEDRVHARLRADEKELLERAAQVAGLSMSRFMLTCALKEARKVMREQATTLTRAEAVAFGEQLLHSPEPTETALTSLRKARRWHSR